MDKNIKHNYNEDIKGYKEDKYNYHRDKNNWMIVNGKKIKLRKYLRNLSEEVFSIVKRIEEQEVDVEFSKAKCLEAIKNAYSSGGMDKVTELLESIQKDLIEKMQEIINQIDTEFEEIEAK